jgi:hypothetical protein
MAKETGAKNCQLLRLPYYDSIRMVCIDPMHCLYLGIAKTVLTIWKDKGNAASSL